LIAGCGYVGRALAELLADDGRVVWGLSRNPEGLPAGTRPVRADVLDPESLRAVPSHPDAIVYAVAPSERDPEAYRRAYVEGLRNVLEGAGTEEEPYGGHLLLVASTGVYGTEDGRWVDEDTPPEPIDGTGRVLLEAEATAGRLGGTASVLRLGGIYGPGRDRTVRRVADGDAACPEPGRYGNRIHRDDAAAALRHLLLLWNPEPLYLGVDHDPAELREVVRWVAARVGVEDPCARPSHPDAARPRSRRGTNKRCSNRRLLGTGFRFRYPTFREGYATLIDGLGVAGPTDHSEGSA
jgi:nucleoside-diphosphate-sugar epimerase